LTASVGLSAKATKLLTDRNVATLVTMTAAGWPHATPVWVDSDGTDAIVNTHTGRIKADHIRRDPRVALSVYDSYDPFVYVTLRGIATLSSEGADRHIDTLAYKYLGADEYPAHMEEQAAGHRRVIIRIRPEWVLFRGA
jgi:PPOX class probable F420-dependent enzyme